jgi:hypothetical protein
MDELMLCVGMLQILNLNVDIPPAPPVTVDGRR